MIKSIRETLQDENLIGNLAGHVYPRTSEELTRAFDHGYTKVILAGDIGWGKTSVANIITLKIIDELTSFMNPGKALGLGKGELVHVLNLTAPGVKTMQAQRTEALIRKSPRLMLRKPSFHHDEIRFENGVRVVSGSIEDVCCLGLNIASAFVYADCKPFSDIQKSSLITSSIHRRITSRFLGRDNNGINTKLVVIGYSVNSQKLPNTEFMRFQIQEASINQNTIVMEHGSPY